MPSVSVPQSALLVLCQILSVVVTVASCFWPATSDFLTRRVPVFFLVIFSSLLCAVLTRYLPTKRVFSWFTILANLLPLAFAAHLYLHSKKDEGIAYGGAGMSMGVFYLMLALLSAFNMMLQLAFKALNAFTGYPPVFSLYSGDLDFKAGSKSDAYERVGSLPVTASDLEFDTPTPTPKPSSCSKEQLPIWIMRVVWVLMCGSALATALCGFYAGVEPEGFIPEHVMKVAKFIGMVCMWTSAWLQIAHALVAIGNSFRLSSRRRLLVTGVIFGSIHCLVSIVLFGITQHAVNQTPDLPRDRQTQPSLFVAFLIQFASVAVSIWMLRKPKLFGDDLCCCSFHLDED